jgi:hypothetical protein
MALVDELKKLFKETQEIKITPLPMKKSQRK